MQITINIDEQSGQITVEAEGQKPYQCQSPDECLEYLSDMIKGEEPNEPNQEQEAAEPDQQAMWDQEAAKRSQPGLMA
jgi:hypothetical protein